MQVKDFELDRTLVDTAEGPKNERTARKSQTTLEGRTTSGN